MAKNNKTRSFYVLYSDKTWVFDQSECVLGSIYIIKCNRVAIHIDLLLLRMIITKKN